MSKYRIKKLDNTIEKRILIYLIVSTEFLTEIEPILDINYFNTPYIQTVVNWVLDYYDEYEKAPFNDIQSIFEQEQIKLESEEVSLIEKLLINISETYTIDDKLNIEYMRKKTLNYFQKRELEITADNVSHYLSQNEINAAENELLKFKKVALNTSECLNVYDTEIIKNAFADTEESLMYIPGYLGRFLGPVQRGWLVAIEGGYKKGKTWWLIELATYAIMDNLNVIIFSLEMSKNEIIKRIYQRIVGLPKEENEYLIPIMDCYLNQNGECLRPECTSSIQLLNEDGEKPEFEDAGNYQVCTQCRGIGNLYEPATWFLKKKFSALTETKAIKKAESFNKTFKNNFKLKAYPRFSANIKDIKRDLDILEMSDNFIPDVILIDYADILKPENENSTGVLKEDDTWVSLAQLAGERSALTITPTQITKQGQDAKIIELQHTARWSGKLGHIDLLIGINQTIEEKNEGVQRLNKVLHRHMDFDPTEQCMILQNFSIGAVHLDSEHFVAIHDED